LKIKITFNNDTNKQTNKQTNKIKKLESQRIWKLSSTTKQFDKCLQTRNQTINEKKFRCKQILYFSLTQ
jgi:hypothetical protein